MRLEVNSNWFGILNRFERSFSLHGNLHGGFIEFIKTQLHIGK